MKKILLIGLKLGLICMVTSLSLGFVNVVTLPSIAKNKEIALQKALAIVNSTGTPGEEVFINGDNVVKSYYPVKLNNGEINSYILTLIGEGYGGDLFLLANYEKSGKLISSVLMEHKETPGLGDSAERSFYHTKFIGKGDDTPIPTKKSELSVADADAIGGATITFLGVANALSHGSDYVKKIGEKK